MLLVVCIWLILLFFAELSIIVVLEYKSCIHKAKKGSPFALTKSFLAPVDIAPYGGRRGLVCVMCSLIMFIYIHSSCSSQDLVNTTQ